jgi:cation diffusion facilitator family transporter
LINFLVKLFVKDYKNVNDSKVRERFGKLSSITGILVNVLLFALKFVAGKLSNSVSIVADAMNNLSDAGSSVISLISFKISGKPADKEHPFGHERMEYIASSVVSVIVILIGFELLKSSVQKVLNPSPVEVNTLSLCILAFSIAAKLWLYLFNTKLSKRIGSTVMRTTAADSLSDVLATSAVLVSAVISPLIGFQLDGFMGAVISVFIMVTGIKILKEPLDLLLGNVPPDELINLIENFIKKYEGVMDIHDLIVHNYGPNRCFASVHVEVDAKQDILKSHDLIDYIERDILEDLNIHLVIHLDPIVIDDPYVIMLYDMTKQIIREIDETLTVHDFRVAKGITHSNLIFDVTVPYEYKKNDCLILEEITRKIREKDKSLYAVVTIDRTYVSSPGNRKNNRMN